jgi:hypothetical protein
VRLDVLGLVSLPVQSRIRVQQLGTSTRCLAGQITNILHSILAEPTYEEIIEKSWVHYRDHQLSVMYCSQHKARTHQNDESLQEFATAIEQLSTRPLCGCLGSSYRWRKLMHRSTEWETKG